MNNYDNDIDSYKVLQVVALRQTVAVKSKIGFST